MGITSSKQNYSAVPLFSIEQFQQIQPNSCNYRQSHGTYTSYQHKITKEQVDKYELYFQSSKQSQIYYECFLHRYRQQYIVNTLEYVDLTKTQFCSNLYRAQIYLQHIPVRLGDITDIPYPDNLYIIRNCLLGFGLLYSYIGYFEIQQDHICVNNYGELKVWLNTDLSKNYPQDKDQYLNSKQSSDNCYKSKKCELDMVHQIINLIQKNTNIEQCPIEISEYFKKKNKMYPNFSQALQLLNFYITQHKTQLPKYCQSIFQVFQETQSHNEMENHKFKKEFALYQQQAQSFTKERPVFIQHPLIRQQKIQAPFQYKDQNQFGKELQINDITIPKLLFRQQFENSRRSKTVRSTIKNQICSEQRGNARTNRVDRDKNRTTIDNNMVIDLNQNQKRFISDQNHFQSGNYISNSYITKQSPLRHVWNPPINKQMEPGNPNLIIKQKALNGMINSRIVSMPYKFGPGMTTGNMRPNYKPNIIFSYNCQPSPTSTLEHNLYNKLRRRQLNRNKEQKGIVDRNGNAKDQKGIIFSKIQDKKQKRSTNLSRNQSIEGQTILNISKIKKNIIDMKIGTGQARAQLKKIKQCQSANKSTEYKNQVKGHSKFLTQRSGNIDSHNNKKSLPLNFSQSNQLYHSYNPIQNRRETNHPHSYPYTNGPTRVQGYLSQTNVLDTPYNKNTKTDKHKDKIDHNKQILYYETGTGSQQIDPQIAADLLKYL